jgi:hypothetical protein
MGTTGKQDTSTFECFQERSSLTTCPQTLWSSMARSRFHSETEPCPSTTLFFPQRLVKSYSLQTGQKRKYFLQFIPKIFKSPNIYHTLNGVEIIYDGSGSHHQLRNLTTRMDLIKSATSKSGGVNLYSNHQGCDGDRLYFDGSALINANRRLLAQESQFSLKDIEVVSQKETFQKRFYFNYLYLESSLQLLIWIK